MSGWYIALIAVGNLLTGYFLGSKVGQRVMLSNIYKMGALNVEAFIRHHGLAKLHEVVGEPPQDDDDTGEYQQRMRARASDN